MNIDLVSFFLGFASSLLASVFLWYLTVYRPRNRDEKNIREYSSSIIRGVIGQSKIVFQTIFKEAGIQREFSEISLEDFKLVGPKVKLKKEAPPIIGFFILKGASFAQYLCFYKERTVTYIQRVFTYIYFLDSELVKRLNRILHCRYFVLCDEWLKNIDLVTDPDLTAFDEDLYEYYTAIPDLEHFCLKKGILKE
jgi:hypothetical protein